MSLYGQRDDADVEFDIGTIDTFTDAFAGSRVTVQVDDSHEIVDGVGTTEVAAVEVGGVWAAASDEIRAQGATDPRIERDLGTLQGMTTGAGESIDSLRALYNEPIETITAVREIPGAVANLDEIIAAMPDAIEAQQQRNNPHDPDENPQLYDSFRQGWYEGYIAWFVVEAVIPAGEAGKAIKSSDRVRKTVDEISTPRIRRAAQMAGKAGYTAKAPVRYSRLQLSRGLSASIGATREAGERLLSSVPSNGRQLRVAKTIDGNDIDGSVINRFDGDEAEAAGRLTARYSDSGARLLKSDICNSPCKSTFESVNGYREDGLTNKQSKQLLQAYTKADDADVGPGGRMSASDVQNTVEDLDDANIQNVRGTMASVSGSKSGFRQISSEVDVADSIRKGENIDGENIRMQQTSSDIDGAPNSKTEVDVKVEGEVSIKGETYQSPAIESKHWNPEKWPPKEIDVEPSWDGQLSDLRKKLVTQAVDGEDNLIVVLPRQTIVKHDSKFDDVIENTKRDLEANNKVTADEVQITYTSYEELGK